MRMKMVCDDRTLREIANEFLALKKAQKVRERTLNDYRKYINKFIEQSENSLDVDVLKVEILDFFADIPKTSPARFNHPYQYLHALFEWCAKQDYLPYNPFRKLQLKKVQDEGNVQPAEIKDIQAIENSNITILTVPAILLLTTKDLWCVPTKNGFTICDLYRGRATTLEKPRNTTNAKIVQTVHTERNATSAKKTIFLGNMVIVHILH